MSPSLKISYSTVTVCPKVSDDPSNQEPNIQNEERKAEEISKAGIVNVFHLNLEEDLDVLFGKIVQKVHENSHFLKE